MLTLSAAMTTALAQGGFKPVVLVAIAAPGLTYKKAISRPSTDPTVKTYPVAVDRIDIIEAKLDPLEHKHSIGSCTVTLLREWFAPLHIASRLKGKEVKITFGRQDTAEADFAPYFVGTIEKIIPSADGKSFEVELYDRLGHVLESKISASFPDIHPLDAIESILIDYCYLTGSITASTFDPSNSAYSSFSHYVVQRRGIGAENVIDHEPAKDLIDHLALLCNGAVIEDEDGTVRFRLYNPGAADDHWDEDEYNGKIEVEEQGGHLVNEVHVNFYPHDGGYAQQYNHRDSVSVVTFLATDASNTRLYSHSIDMPWVSGLLFLEVSFDPLYTSRLEVSVATPPCGFLISGSQQDAWRKVSGTRPIVLRYAWADTVEVIQVKNVSGFTFHDTPPDLPGQAGNLPLYAYLDQVTHGFLGTTAVLAHTGDELVDMTIPYNVSSNILNRFAYGIDVIKVQTGLNKFNVQTADIVTLDSSTYASYGKNGLSSSTKWEVIGKRTDLHAGTIDWTLAEAPTPARTSTHSVPVGPIGEKLGNQIRAARKQLDISQHVADGGVVTNPSGLNIAVSTMQAAGGLDLFKKKSFTAVVESNRDTYFSQNVVTGKVTSISVPTGSAAPKLATAQTPVAKIVAAAAVSSVVTAPRPATATTAKQANVVSGSKGLIANGKFSQAKAR